MEADDLDAAVLAADERLADLFSDLKSLVARSDAERKEAAGSRRSDAGKMTASTDWDELLGCEKESVDDEDAPQPRRTPIARPTSREPNRRVSFSPWTIDSLAAEETTTATRTTNRAKKVGGQNLTLRRAVEDILRADWGRVGTPTLGEDVQDTVRREKEATKELRREMNLLLERRRVDALATRPPQNATAPDLSHSPWKSAADDVVFIDPSLLEGDGTEVRRSRAGKQSGVRAPWGGGGGRNRQGSSPATGKLWPRGSIVTQSTPPWLIPGYRRPADPSVQLSRFEERCASAVRAHLETLTMKKRRELLDDWGAVGGGFDGAELSVQIELTTMHADTIDVGGIGGVALTQGLTHFVPVQAQPLRRLKLCLGDPTTNVTVAGQSAHATLGWINVDYDENGMCDLPAFCGSVLYRRRISGGETETASSGAGNNSLGDATPGETKREYEVMPSPTGFAKETRLKIACFLRSPLGVGSADGDDGGKTALLSIMESVPRRRDGDGSTGGGAGSAAGSADAEAGRAPLNSCESMDLRRLCKIVPAPGPPAPRG